VQRHRQERHRLLLAGREELVDLARRRLAGDLAREPEETVGGLAHCRDDHDEAKALFLVGLLHPLGHGLYVLGRRYRAATVLLDDDAHSSLTLPLALSNIA
jgi:hypothetical protein